MTVTTYNLYINRMIAALTALVALCAFAYGTFLLLAVAHAAGITRAQDDARDLAGRIGALDAHYLQETAALTPAQAAALGLVKPTNVAVVYTALPLTFNGR